MYGKAKLGTLPYPTIPYPNPKPAQPHPASHHLTQPYPLHLPYPTLTRNPTPNPPHRTRPTPLNPTPTLTPYPYIYPTLPYPDPHPTQLLPYSCPAIHRLALPCPALPCPALPYYTLPYPSAVYVGPFRCFGSSVVHFGIWVRFGPFIPFRFVSKQSVQTGWARSSPSIACQNYLNFTFVDLTNVEL